MMTSGTFWNPWESEDMCEYTVCGSLTANCTEELRQSLWRRENPQKDGCMDCISFSLALKSLLGTGSQRDWRLNQFSMSLWASPHPSGSDLPL